MLFASIYAFTRIFNQAKGELAIKAKEAYDRGDYGRAGQAVVRLDVHHWPYRDAECPQRVLTPVNQRLRPLDAEAAQVRPRAGACG